MKITKEVFMFYAHSQAAVNIMNLIRGLCMYFTHSRNPSLDPSEVIFSLLPPVKGGFAENQSRSILYITLLRESIIE